MGSEYQKYKFIFIPVLAWIIFLIYIVWGPKVYAYLIENDGRPIEHDILTTQFASGKEAKAYIKGITAYKNRSAIYEMIGWAFSMLTPEEPTDNYQTDIVVFNESKNYVFKTVPKKRIDIVNYFSRFDMTIINPGFSGLINKHAIDYGTYCLGIRLTHLENQTSQLILMDKVLEKTPLKFQLSTDKKLSCEVFLNKQSNSN